MSFRYIKFVIILTFTFHPLFKSKVQMKTDKVAFENNKIDKRNEVYFNTCHI